jgi:hypothetical protein
MPRALGWLSLLDGKGEREYSPFSDRGEAFDETG